MAVIFSEHATHRATMLTAEQTLQAALVGATAAQAKTAIVNFYRTARSSAITNGLQFQQFSTALRELIGQET
jgi:hypothetical protein